MAVLFGCRFLGIEWGRSELFGSSVQAKAGARGLLHVTVRPEESNANLSTKQEILMAYEIVGGSPAAMDGNNGLGLLDAGTLGKAPPACPPFKFPFDNNCPFTFLTYSLRRIDLCDRILGAINLATKAAARLETKSQGTLALFHKVFGQKSSDPWELPGQPSRKMPAGDMVARRLRTVAKELQTRDTIYRCVPADRCQIRSSGGGGSGGSDPGAGSGHPTETIVIDAVALAVLCKNEVWLCPQFWRLQREEQEGTVLHEMFHLCFGLTCAWFQHDGKERKRNNAHCYEAFALSVAGFNPNTAECDKTPL